MARRLLERPGIAGGLLAAVAIAVYAGSLANGFAFDDVAVILGDPRLRDPARWLELVTGGYWWGAERKMALWRPLTSLSFAVDRLVAGENAAWYHGVNVLLHAGVTLLAWRLLRRWFAEVAAWAGALLFALHPVRVEAVANVVGRGEILAAGFVFAALLAWDRRDERPVGWRTALGVAALYLAGLLAKETAVVLPGLLVLVDLASGRWRWERGAVEAYLRSRGAALAAVAVVLPAYLGARRAVLGRLAPESLHAAAEVLTSREELFLTALQAWPHYLRLLLFPRILLASYAPRVITPATEWTVLSAAGLVVLAGLVIGGLVAVRSGRRRTALGFLWFPLAILPVSNLVVTVGVLVAERTLYLPGWALSVGVAGAVAALPALVPRSRRAVVGALAAGLLVLGARTVDRVPAWRSTEAVFAALERDAPECYRVPWFRARQAREGGDRVAAARLYREALGLWPHRLRLIIEAATLAVERGRLPEVRRLAGHAVRVHPRSIEAHRLRAAAAWDMGDRAAALEAARRGLALDPDDRLLREIRREAGGDGEVR